MRHNGQPFQLPIQPGWKAGTKVKFEDQRIAFEIADIEHETFSRVGNDLHCTVFPSTPWAFFTGDTQQVATLDRRRINATFAPFALSCTVRREGMPFKSTDATGSRTADKGDLVVHLLLNWSAALQQAQGWGRIAAYIAVFYLLLQNPMLAMMMFFGYRAMTGQ